MRISSTPLANRYCLVAYLLGRCCMGHVSQSSPTLGHDRKTRKVSLVLNRFLFPPYLLFGSPQKVTKKARAVEADDRLLPSPSLLHLLQKARKRICQIVPVREEQKRTVKQMFPRSDESRRKKNYSLCQPSSYPEEAFLPVGLMGRRTG